MRRISLFLFALFPSCGITCACGGSTTVDDQTLVGPACQTAADCPCPPDYEASCEDATCLCLRTEVEVPPEVGCESASDCDCGSSLYTATCQESGMCYCSEVNRQCYPLTRGEFIDQIMGKLIDLETYEPLVGQTYADVPPNHEYYAAIEAAAEYGVMHGYSNGTFGPDDHLNRAETAKVVVVSINGLEGYTAPATPTYLDVAPAQWYFDYVEAATWHGLTRGYVKNDGTPTGYFGPADVASSCFVNEMVAHAEFSKIPEPDQITLAIDHISWMNRIAVAGLTEQLSVGYKAHYTSSAHPLNDLTVINQPDGEGTAPVTNDAIARVYINCAPPSGTGTYTMTEGALVNGVAQFTNLGCYDETGNGLDFEVVYDVSTFANVGDGLSGQTFRLVLQDGRLVDSQSEVPVNTVRKTSLSFQNSPVSGALHNGQVTLFPFQVLAHPNGSGGLSRLVFVADKYDADGDGVLKMSQFRFYRGATVLDVNVFDQNGQNLSDSGVLETTKFVVSFPNEEVVVGGTTQPYSLKATAMGVEMDDSFTVRLDFGDEDLPVTGKTGETTPNTARIISSVDTIGLFPGMLFWLYGTPDDRNVIWTDRSADAHHYSIEDSASSYDFTNGYALGLVHLTPVTITAN